MDVAHLSSGCCGWHRPTFTRSWTFGVCWSLKLGWSNSRPYDDQLVQMDATDRSKPSAVNFLPELFFNDQKFSELESLMQRVRIHGEEREADSPDVQMIALYHRGQSLTAQERFQENVDVERWLVEMVGPGFQPHLPGATLGLIIRHVYGVFARAAGRLKDAKEWFRKALIVEEDGGMALAHRQHQGYTHAMDRCLQEDGRPERRRKIALGERWRSRRPSWGPSI